MEDYGHHHDPKATGMEELHTRRLDLLALAQGLGETAVDAIDPAPVNTRPKSPRHYPDFITDDEVW